MSDGRIIRFHRGNSFYEVIYGNSSPSSRHSVEKGMMRDRESSRDEYQSLPYTQTRNGFTLTSF